MSPRTSWRIADASPTPSALTRTASSSSTRSRRNVVNANEATPDSSGDVIVDFGDGFAVAVLIADCLPILLVDEDSPTLAVVHAGWRGLESNVIESALAHFEHHDAVHAFLGPSISGAAYQVGPDVAEHFAKVPGALAPTR